jgi:tRNA uridine 5-carbamoylmethylation protein Kti12
MFAIIFVGFPGIGKTSIGQKLAEIIPNTVLIEQDDFYKANKADNERYLNEIKKTLINSTKTTLILSKNHHTYDSLNEVISLLQDYNTRYLMVNFLPEFIDSYSESQFIETLLDRIELRKTYSHLVIDEKHSRKRAQAILTHGFLKLYKESFERIEKEFGKFILKLDYMNDLNTNVELILAFFENAINSSKNTLQENKRKGKKRKLE